MRSWSLWLLVVLIGLAGGAVLYGAAASWLRKQETYSQPTLGRYETTVRGRTRHEGRDRTCYQPVIRYWVDGAAYTHRGSCVLSVPFEPNARVPIRYDPRLPSQAIIATFGNLHQNHLMFAALGMFMLLASGATIGVGAQRHLRGRRRSR